MSRWILCGKSDAAVSALEYFVECGDEVWAVGAHGDDGKDGWQRSLRAAANRLRVRFDQPRGINASGFVSRLAAFSADALLSIQYDQILHGPLLDGVGCPCLNFHFALLPRHRGVSPVAWAIQSGDEEAGVTLHHMVERIDAGAVIAQRAVRIDPGGTARELYERLSQECVALVRENHAFGSQVLGRRLPQNESDASYHRAGDFDFSQRVTDWRRPAPELHAWLRAMIFPPLQFPEVRWRGQALRIERVATAIGTGAGAEPGRVLACGSEGVEVAAGGGSIRVAALADVGDPGEPTPSRLREIAVGDRLC